MKIKLILVFLCSYLICNAQVIQGEIPVNGSGITTTTLSLFLNSADKNDKNDKNDKMGHGSIFDTINFLDLMMNYEDYCEELVEDTITVYEIEHFSLLPVKDKKGNIEFYHSVSKDTVWDSYKCKEYKHEKYSGLIYVTPNFLGYNSKEKSVEKKVICKVKRRQNPTFDDYFWKWIKEKYYAKN